MTAFGELTLTQINPESRSELGGSGHNSEVALAQGRGAESVECYAFSWS